MSFVERHKLWLLPVLGLGVVAVGWYNYQAFAGPKAPPPETPAPQAAQEASPAAPPAPAAPSAPAAPATSAAPVNPSEGGLWDDLKALSVVPGDLNRLEALDTQARGVLPPSALQDGGSEALRLSGPRMWVPKERPRPSLGGQESGPPAPDPDILIQLPEGRRVWIDGEGYREEEPLAQKPWRVRRIGPRAVELQGPRGLETKSIHPATPPAAKEGP